LTIGLKPGAHATASNDAYVYAVWLESDRGPERFEARGVERREGCHHAFRVYSSQTA